MKKDQSVETLLTHLSTDPKTYQGVVNTPPHRASTIVFENLAAFEQRGTAPFAYGRAGTPSTMAFEKAIAELEGAAGSVATCSGLSAITVALMAFTRTGDKVLIPDNVYGPTRKFCAEVLNNYGVEAVFYDPMGDVGSLIDPAVKLLFIEAPGSLTYEVPNIAHLVSVAQSAKIITVMDNSWATPLLFKPLDHGIDISLMSATKYISGHSDAMLGVVSGTTETYAALKRTALMMGLCAGSEEIYLGLRGLRTLHVRMAEHERRALEIAQWLKEQKAVARVMHPALSSFPSHDNWKSFFKGACGTFGLVLNTTDKSKLAALVDGFKLFRIGASWGGYESLCFPEQPAALRTAVPFAEKGLCLRLHIGFEDVDDLKKDLSLGFERMGLA